jgi:hypothetical protein
MEPTMTRLRPGALDQLSEEQKARLLEAHNKLSKHYENAVTNRAPEKPPAFNQEAATRIMHRMPTPHGTQSLIRPTPRGLRLEKRAERIAERAHIKALAGIERSWKAQDLKKEFSKARDRARLKTHRLGLQR